jgi:hypothetical protein
MMIRAGAGLAVLLVLFGTAVAIDAATQPARGDANLRAGVGMRVLQHYDVVAVAARDPAWRLGEIAAARPAEAALIRDRAAAYYSAERVDTLGGDPAFGRALWRAPDSVMAAQWRSAILEEPVVYLRHRADVMRWLLAPPALGRCLPVFTGVEGPPAMLADLGLQPRLSPGDRALSAYAGRFFATPVYSHVAYGLLAVVVAGLALRRGETTDVVMVCLMGAALAFAATFLVISIACDYRYLYALDLAALVGALYLAIDPPFGRRAQRESSTSRAA